MKKYMKIFKEDSIRDKSNKVIDLFYNLIQKYSFSVAVQKVALKMGISENEVLNILQESENAYFESTTAMKTMVNRLNTAKLKSRKGKDDITVKRAEDLWKKATEIAKKQGQENNPAYIMGIWKRMTGYKKPRKTKKR